MFQQLKKFPDLQQKAHETGLLIIILLIDVALQMLEKSENFQIFTSYKKY